MPFPSYFLFRSSELICRNEPVPEPMEGAAYTLESILIVFVWELSNEPVG